MSDYFKLFDTHDDYEDFVEDDNMVTPNVALCAEENDVHYNDKDWEEEYLTFEIIQDGTIVWKTNSQNFTRAISYTLDDGETWTSITSTTSGVSINVKKGQYIGFRGGNTTYATAQNYFNRFGGTAQFNIKGNIMSLVYNNNFAHQTTLSGGHNFKYLFRDTNVVNAYNLILPATTLTSYCYNNMFYNCRNLITPPTLPATTLANFCYDHMFSCCVSLATTPKLPALTLAYACYQNMFSECVSLATTPELPATTLAENCYYFMFDVCRRITKTTPELPATILRRNCYYGMFSGCTGLTTAPKLPATTLANFCYHSMFQNCTSLTTTPELPARTLVDNCYNSMFSGCTSLTTAPKLPATTLANNCYNGMFQNCTSLTTAPELPAPYLPSGCYVNMFYGCYSLNNIVCLAKSVDTQINGWTTGVAHSGTFTKLSTTIFENGVNGIPNGWVVNEINKEVLIGIWVDDFKGYDYGDNEYNEMVLNELNNELALETASLYEYFGDTLFYGGNQYYMWEKKETSDNIYFPDNSILLTTTINEQELISQSLEDDITNTFTSFAAMLNYDCTATYRPSHQIELLKIADPPKKLLMEMWIDDFPVDEDDELDGEPVEDVMERQISSSDTCIIGNHYLYYGDTIEYDNDTYYVWKMVKDCQTSFSENVFYLLTTTDDYVTLYNESLEDDYSNTFDSFAGRFSSDMEEYENEDTQSLVKIVSHEEPIMRMWIDDFPSSAEYEEGSAHNKMIAAVEDPEGENANPYEYKGFTLTYNGNTYYLWEMPTWWYNGDYNNVGYLVTSSISYSDLYSESLEDDLTNHFTSCVGQFNDDKELYIEQNIGEDNEIYLIKIEEL